MQIRPSDYPTPVPTPVATPGPTRGPPPTPNPLGTPAPGHVNPSSRPNYQDSYHYYPGAVKTPAFNTPIVQKPLPTLIPQFPAKGIRTPAARTRSAETGAGPTNKMLQVNPATTPSYTISPGPVYEPVKGYELPYQPAGTPTPQPTGGYEPVQGYELPMNPHATPTPYPAGGATYSHESELPYHPVNTPTPVPSGGLEPVQGYGLPYHPVNTPTPAPVSPSLFRPGAGAAPFASKPKPVISAIPQLPASRFRTRSG